MLYRELEKCEKAYAPAKEAFEIFKKALGHEHSATTLAGNDFGVVAETLGRYQESEETFREILRIREKSLPSGHAHVNLSHSNLANTLALLDKIAEATEHREMSMAGYEKLGDEFALQFMQELVGHGNLLSMAGKYNASQTSLERALLVDSRMNFPKSKTHAVCYQVMGINFSALQKFDQAEECARQAIAIYQDTVGNSHTSTIEAESRLVHVLVSQKRFKEALRLSEESSERAKATYGRDSEVFAKSLADVASCYTWTRDFAKASDLGKEVVAIYEQLGDSSLPNFQRYLTDLGMVLVELQQYPEAESVTRRALTLTDRMKTKDRLTISRINSVMTSILLIKGEDEKAMEFAELATGIDENDQNGSPLARFQLLNTNAEMLREKGEFAKAEPLYKKALELAKSTVGEESSEYAIALNNLGLMYQLAGYRRSLAENCFKEALRIRESVLGPDHPLTGNSLSTLALLYDVHNLDDLAEPLFVRALSAREAGLGPDHEKTILTRRNYAYFLEEHGKLNQAADLFDRCFQGTHRFATQYLLALSQSEQEAFLAKKYSTLFQESLALGVKHRDDPEFVRRSTNWLLNGKALSNEALAAAQTMSAETRDPKRQKIAEDLRQTKTQLATLAMSVEAWEGARSQAENMRSLVAKEKSLASELALLTGTNSHPESKWRDWKDVSLELPKDACFVDFAVVDIQESSFLNLFTSKVPHLAAWITKPSGSGDPVIVDLGPISELESLVKRFQKAIGRGLASGSFWNGSEREEEKRIDELLLQISDKVWQPLESYAGSSKEIIISPDHCLWMIPWAALPVGNAGSRSYLIESYSIRYASSARDLLVQSVAKPKPLAVMVANPSYALDKAGKIKAMEKIFKQMPTDEESLSSRLLGQSLFGTARSLPETGLEALRAEPSLRTYVGNKPFLFTQDDALETVVKRLERPKVLSLSTHGFFLDRSLEANPQGPSALDIDRKAALENPLLRCGLSLAGCDDRMSFVGGDDGILTGLEITCINLKGTELVFLNACETGVGSVRNAEGVAGLRQAFQIAGAEAVIATLWPVASEESKQIFTDYFEHLASGNSKSESLRKAQLRMIDNRRQKLGGANPFFWAAHTLTGR